MSAVNTYVLPGPRQGGKTYQFMTEIHELIQQGRRSEILVVFPEMGYLHFWTREWEQRFPHVPTTDYTVMESMDRIRGKYYGEIFVEDIETYQEGIYEDKIQYLYAALTEGGSITFSYSPTGLSQRSHSKKTSVADLIRRRTRINDKI